MGMPVENTPPDNRRTRRSNTWLGHFGWMDGKKRRVISVVVDFLTLFSFNFDIHKKFRSPSKVCLWLLFANHKPTFDLRDLKTTCTRPNLICCFCSIQVLLSKRELGVKTQQTNMSTTNLTRLYSFFLFWKIILEWTNWFMSQIYK
jgi:hypothetical protein